jgi:hypothetical protein
VKNYSSYCEIKDVSGKEESEKRGGDHTYHDASLDIALHEGDFMFRGSLTHAVIQDKGLWTCPETLEQEPQNNEGVAII